MGLDSRYDCFDCQKNSFIVTDKKTLDLSVLFRIPRQSDPGYLQSKIHETLHAVDPDTNNPAQMQSKGEMFGLTFWENWYILGEQSTYNPDKLIDPSIKDDNINNLKSLAVSSATASSVVVDKKMPNELGITYPTVSNPINNNENNVNNNMNNNKKIKEEMEMKLVYYTGHTLQGNYKGI